jgi:hypothetical protein
MIAKYVLELRQDGELFTDQQRVDNNMKRLLSNDR